MQTGHRAGDRRQPPPAGVRLPWRRSASGGAFGGGPLTRIENWDEYDEMNLRALDRRTEEASLRGRAEQSALEEHPVVQYVKSLPVEGTAYPAIRYLRANDDRKAPRNDRETPALIDDWTELPEVRKGRGPREAWLDYQEMLRSGTLDDGPDSDAEDDPVPGGDTEYITWTMPGHDLKRPREKGCGFIRSSDGSSVLFTACSGDHDHHLKAKRRHCWSMSCPDCMNDTAIRNGVAVEKQFLVVKRLCAKQGLDLGRIKHFVVSPPQAFAKSAIQDEEHFGMLCRHIQNSLTACGALGGLMIVHPWRQQKDRWAFSPHFHVLLYGHIDTTLFRRRNRGWIVKMVHAREKIRSIRHTVGYLYTHMGIARSERTADEIDFDGSFLDWMMPGLSVPTTSAQRASGRAFRFTESDYNDLIRGRGRMAGDLSGMDWLEWTKERLVKEHRTRFFGLLSRNRLKVVARFRVYKARRCRECGALLRIYDGAGDMRGRQANYIQEVSVYAFADDYEIVIGELLACKSVLREHGLTPSDFSASVALAVSTEELCLDDGLDVVLDSPLSIVTIHDDGSITQEVCA